MIAIVFVSAFALMVTGLGWLVVDKLDGSGCLISLERLTVSFVIGCFVIYLGVFIIAPYRLDPTSVWSLLAISSVVAVPGLRRIPWQQFATSIRSETHGLATDKWAALLWFLMVTVALTSLLQALAPPNDYDALAYHLAFPRLDVEMGRAVLDLKTGWPATFFPSLGSHLTRVALVVANAEAAQLIHGLFGVLGAMTSAALVLRLGHGKYIAMGGAIMFLSIRMVIWQMGTVETDIPVAALAVISLVLYLATRTESKIGLEVLFGLMVACAILMKYHGLATILSLVPLILYDVVTGRKSVRLFAIAPIVALVAVTPHMARDFLLTGNPIFPLMNGFFNPHMPPMLETVAAMFGTGRGILDFITAPWNISIFPTHYFDGMMLGTPYLLAFVPLVLLDREAVKKWVAPLSYVFIYFVLWFWLLSLQVRFLAPVMPVMAALASVGIAVYWEKIRSHDLLKAAFIGIAFVAAVNQFMFVGIYSALRLPVAVGLVSPTYYHNNTPTMDGAYYTICKYIEENLETEERFFILAPFVPYYCPQAAATLQYFEDEQGWWMKSKQRPEMSRKEFITRLNENSFRYFVVQLKTSSRRRVASIAKILDIDLSLYRFGNLLEQAFTRLEPLKQGPYSAVYDGREVMAILNQQTAEN